MRGWKTTCLCELAIEVKAGEEDLTIKQLPAVEKGRPLLLGQEFDHQVCVYLAALRDAGEIVNAPIAISAATGIGRRHDSNLLAMNGGHIEAKGHHQG